MDPPAGSTLQDFPFQPSELAKVAVILYLATVISKRPMAMRTFKGNIKLLATILPIFVVVAYNNLSTAIIIVGIAFIMVFISSPKTAPFILAFVGVALLAVVFIFGTYRQERVRSGYTRKITTPAIRPCRACMRSDPADFLARGWARVSRNWALSRRRRMI